MSAGPTAAPRSAAPRETLRYPALTPRHALALFAREFAALQSDTALQRMSAFDLIDHCTLLIEQLVQNKDALPLYVRAFFIYNYFVTNFILVYFKGFNPFMELSYRDFVLYAHLYNFLRRDDLFDASAFGVELATLRRWMVDFLEEKQCLKYNVEELYLWLDEYIEYLKADDGPEPKRDDAVFDASFTKEDTCSSEESRADMPYPDIDELERALEAQAEAEHRVPPARGFPASELHYQRLAPVKMTLSHDAGLARPEARRDSGHTNPNEGHGPGQRVSRDWLGGQQHLSGQLQYPIGQSQYPIGQLQHPNGQLQNQNGQLHHPNGQLQNQNGHLSNVPNGQWGNRFPGHFQSQGQPRAHAQGHGPKPYAPQGAPHLQNRLGSVGPSVPGQYIQSPWGQPVLHPSEWLGGPASQAARPPQVRLYLRFQQLQLNEEACVRGEQRAAWMEAHAVHGLKNLGSSCYINATVQVLFGLVPFAEALQPGLIIQKGRQAPLAEAVFSLLQIFHANGGATIAPTKFMRVLLLLKPDFQIPLKQQDAQEFLLFFLDKLHEELRQPPSDPAEYMRRWKLEVPTLDRDEYLAWYTALAKSEGESPINDMCQGHVQSKLKCNKCGHHSSSYSPFSILLLAIPAHNGKVVDLTDCLRYFTQDEVLSGDNAWHCPKCNKSEGELAMETVFAPKKNMFRFGRLKLPVKRPVPAPTTISIKRLLFIRLPPVLFVHLSRFLMYNHTDKLSTEIQYPLRLKFNNLSHDIYYSLTGLINHFGSLENGHYTAMVNKAHDFNGPNPHDHLDRPLWCYFDDDRVSMDVPNGDVHVSEHSKLSLKAVYVLCYQRM